MDNNPNKETEIDKPVEAADSLIVSEGVRDFVDIIGDEKIDFYGNSSADR